ncbi:hypothetical protein [Shouchella clausii]|uniref:hypothetical protein n=1 Tax=Shouchella clausii TaxID=79880 RepID=UPI00211B7D56|nr:hypothetical protein [Shouchella clausii]
MLPEKVKVGGVYYETKTMPTVRINHDRNYMGACDYTRLTIEILEELSDERKEDVYAHELVHAIFNEAGFDEHDEDTVTRLGKVLHQVLKDNTNFFCNKKENDKRAKEKGEFNDNKNHPC